LFGKVTALPFAGGSFDVPVLASVNWPALVLATAAIVAVFRFKFGVLAVLGACAILGAAYVLAL
jgi:chromate transporter